MKQIVCSQQTHGNIMCFYTSHLSPGYCQSALWIGYSI